MFDIIKIPKYVLLSIVKDFFEVVDICKLDTALGSIQARDTFRSYLLACNIEYYNSIDVSLPIEAVWWLNTRNIPIKELTVAMSLHQWKHFHPRPDSYTILSRVATLKLNCSSVIKSINRTWLSKAYQYFMGTNNKLLLSNSMTNILKTCSNTLTSLDIEHLPYCLDNILTAVADNLQQLSSLRIVECQKLTAVGLNTLIKNNKGIKKLVLCNNSILWSRTVIDCIITEYLTDSIEHLDMTFNTFEAHYVAIALITLFASCKQLTHFSTNSWDALISAHRFPQLTSLCITYNMTNYVNYYCVPTWHTPTFLLHIVIDVQATTDITVYYITRSHPQLLSLRIINSEYVTVMSVQDTLRYCPHIQHMGFVNCCLIGSDSVYQISNKKLTSLTSIDLSGLESVGTECIVHLLSICVWLKVLNVSGCWRIQSEMVQHHINCSEGEIQCKLVH